MSDDGREPRLAGRTVTHGARPARHERLAQIVLAAAALLLVTALAVAALWIWR